MPILAIDVGTSCVKAAVLDHDRGEPLAAIARVDYAMDRPTADAAEVPAERLWTALTAASRQATLLNSNVDGVGLSCFAPALVLLDEADRLLTPIWTFLDRRSRPAARQVWAAVGQEFLEATGSRPLPGGISAICWRQQLHEDPYLKRKVKHYLHLNGWLGLRMTGERAFDRANASLSGLFGTTTDRRWSPRWCEYFLIDPGWLPPVVCGSTTLGSLRARAAAELGVAAGLPVKLGGTTISSAMLAAGLGPGDLLQIVGSPGVLAGMTDTPKPNATRLTSLVGLGKAFMHVAFNPLGAAALDWLRRLCFQEQSDREFHEQTIPAAQDRSARATLDPPFLDGDRLEIEAHRAAFRDLTLASDRLDLLAALIEALRRRQRQAIVDLGLGERFQRVVVTGDGQEAVRHLLPAYPVERVQSIDEASLRGAAQWFRA